MIVTKAQIQVVSMVTVTFLHLIIPVIDNDIFANVNYLKKRDNSPCISET